MDNLWWRFVRFGFRLLYHEMAFTYDLISNMVSLGAWRCWQRASLRHLEVEPGDLILELAHGTGNLQLDLKHAGYRVVGYDLSRQMGNLARRKLHREGYDANLVRGKAQQLPFPAGTFASVISTFPTDFIVQSVTLDEIYRVLKPQGQLIIVPNGVLTGAGISSAGIEWLYRITGQRSETGMNPETFFEKYGFNAITTSEACPRSMAQVIVARKRD